MAAWFALRSAGGVEKCLGACGVDHGQRVVRVGFKREIVPDRIRQTGVAAIEEDQPREPA